MLFQFPDQAHQRKHGPFGYTRYENYKPWLRDEFTFRCVHCLQRETWYPNGADAFGVDHVKSKAQNPQLMCDYDNLLYACNECNSRKQDELLLDPCEVVMAAHLAVSGDGDIQGLTTAGRDMIDILQLNAPHRIELRRYFTTLAELWNRNPEDAEIRHLYLQSFSYPADLPNLKSLRPAGNSRPEGVKDCFFNKRTKGDLDEVYG